jgi:hypothetical protein
MTNQEELLEKREHIQAKADRIIVFVNNINDVSCDKNELELRKTSLETCLEKFEEIQWKLRLAHCNKAMLMTESKHFGTEYFKTIAKINAFLKNSQVSTS